MTIAVTPSIDVLLLESHPHVGDRAAICRTLTPLLQAARMDPTAMVCRIDRAGTALAVHVTLPAPADTYLRSAIGVRVLDALRAASTKTLGSVDVYVHPSLEASDG